MPQFKRPGAPGSALKEKTAGGFDKPAQAERTPLKPLEKTGIDQELTINDLHINEELMGQPLLMRKYTKELSKLVKKAKSIKNKLELQEAKLRIKFSSDGTGKRVAEVEASILESVEVQDLRVQLYDAEEEVDDYTGIVRAVAQRLETLKEISMNMRKEMS